MSYGSITLYLLLEGAPPSVVLLPRIHELSHCPWLFILLTAANFFLLLALFRLLHQKNEAATLLERQIEQLRKELDQKRLFISRERERTPGARTRSI